MNKTPRQALRERDVNPYPFYQLFAPSAHTTARATPPTSGHVSGYATDLHKEQTMKQTMKQSEVLAAALPAALAKEARIAAAYGEDLPDGSVLRTGDK